MKLRPRFPYLQLILTLLVFEFLGVVFIYFRENQFLGLAQSFVWIGLVIMGVLAYSQKSQIWGSLPHHCEGTPEAIQKTPRLLHGRWPLAMMKTAALFLFFLFFSWQINYLSLYESQPLMYTADQIPIRYDVVSGDLLGYTLRLVLQTWVLALALALVLNKVPAGGRFGFLRGNFQENSSLAWYLSNMMGAAVSIALLFSLGLLALDIGKFISKSFGADVMVLPQFELLILLFTLYMFNITMRFSKKLNQWGQDSRTSLMFVVAIQLVFFIFVYCLSRAMLHFLPEDPLYALMEPFYFDMIDYQRFPNYWQLFITAMSLFMVPLLAHYLLHVCKGEPLMRSVARNFLIPLVICLGITQLIPSAQDQFFEYIPLLNMQPVELNDITCRYEITWASYFSVLILICLMCFLQRSKALTQSLVDIMPHHMGHRVRRVKLFYSRTYNFLIVLLTLYLLAGVVVGLYFSSMFLMATLLGIGLCFVAGLKHQEA